MRSVRKQTFLFNAKYAELLVLELLVLELLVLELLGIIEIGIPPHTMALKTDEHIKSQRYMQKLSVQLKYNFAF